MSIEQNKASVAEFFRLISANNITPAMQMVANDATWWVAGEPGATPLAGSQSKEKIERVIRNMVNQTVAGLQMTVTGMIGEGEQISVEVECRAELRNGRQYCQQYHTIMVFKKGKIAAVREYFDTQHTVKVWLTP